MSDIMHTPNYTPTDIADYTPIVSIFYNPIFDYEDAKIPIIIPANTTLSTTDNRGTIYSSSTILPRGTALGQDSSTKKWLPIVNTPSNGSNTLVGILAQDITVSSSDVNTWAYIRGPFNLSELTGITSPGDYSNHQILLISGSGV
jgi:hypothetical protein